MCKQSRYACVCLCTSVPVGVSVGEGVIDNVSFLHIHTRIYVVMIDPGKLTV